MILNKSIIDDLKLKSDLSFDKVNDFGLLADKMFDVTGRTIGLTTLKRLFGYINDDRRTSNYTLNTVALYLGYTTWADYISHKQIDSEWGYADDAVYIDSLEIDTRLSIRYLDRKVELSVINHDGSKVLKVISSVNSSLKVGDLLYIHTLRKGYILEAEKVVRGESVGNYRTHGEILSIEIL